MKFNKFFILFVDQFKENKNTKICFVSARDLILFIKGSSKIRIGMHHLWFDQMKIALSNLYPIKKGRSFNEKGYCGIKNYKNGQFERTIAT